MIFGKNKDKGIRLKGTKLEVVKIGVNSITENDILVHDQYEQDPGIHLMLAKMAPPYIRLLLELSVRQCFPLMMIWWKNKLRKAKATSPIKCVDDLLEQRRYLGI